MKPVKPDPQQEELALSATMAHAIFPGRVNLYVHEVARALGIGENQVIVLIEQGDLMAIDISKGLKGGSKTPRKYWRIPVSAFDAFIAKRKSSAVS